MYFKKCILSKLIKAEKKRDSLRKINFMNNWNLKYKADD